MKTLLIIILSIFLTSCACFKKPETVVPPDRIVNIDPRVLQYCDLLKENLDISTFDDILIAYSDISISYSVCANKQATSIKLLKEFGGIK